MRDDLSDSDFLFCSNTAGCSIVDSQPKQKQQIYIGDAGNEVVLKKNILKKKLLRLDESNIVII